jgi:hypothetical protein
VVRFGLGHLDADLALPVAIRWRDRSGAARRAAAELRPGSWTLVLGGSR